MIMRASEGRVSCMGGLLSKPSRDVVKRGYLSTQDEMYAKRLAFEAILPTSTCAEHSSCNGIFPSSPDTPPGLPRLMACPVKYEHGMMHTPEFCHQSSGWAHAAGSRHVVSAARCSYGQLVLPQASFVYWKTTAVRPYRGCNGHVEMRGQKILWPPLQSLCRATNGSSSAHRFVHLQYLCDHHATSKALFPYIAYSVV